MGLAKSTEGLNILNPDNIELSINQEQEVFVRLKEQDQNYEDIEIKPAFPLSQIGRYLSLKHKDEEGEEHEIGMIKDISDLDQQSRKVIDKALEKIYFMPKIIKIYEIEEEFGFTRWEVKTKKGRRSFDIKSRRKDVRPYGNGRIIIHDIDGNRYEITDYTELDRESRKILESEI